MENFTDRPTERVQTDRKKSRTGVCVGHYLGLKQESGETETERGGYKYKMMQWSNDVRGREQRAERQTGSVL